MRSAKLLLGAVALIGLVLPAVADDPPPLPRPRPDHDAQPGPPPTAPGQESDQQKLVRQGGGEDAGSLITSVDNTAVAATKLGTTPQPVTFDAEVTEKGARLVDGLVWRIYNAGPDRSGQLVLVAKSQQAAPTLQLKPGDYVVHVAYGRAQSTDTVTVADKPVAKSMVLDAGGLKLNAAITGDIPIPFNLLHFDIFTAGASDADRQIVDERVLANDIVTLTAGTYHVVSYFGDVNAVVRADLRVEPGQLTDATLYQKAAQVSFKLVTDAGGEAIAAVDWTVTAKAGASVFTNTGTFPATVLAEGDYTVSAKREDKTYTRDFHVKAGAAEEIVVVTSAS